MTFELSSEDQARISELAQASHRSEVDVLNDAIHSYFAWQDELGRKIDRAREDVAAGRTHSHEEVGVMLSQWLAR